MIFANPAFLWGLLAVAIPIAVHLFNFRRYRKVYFSNVDRLGELQTESRRRSSVRQWLVLAMRVLAIVFLVLAFAQPVVGTPEGGARSGQTVVSIYLDNTFSMESASTQGSLMDQACRKAREIAATYGVGDRYQLLTADLDGGSMRWLSRDELYEALDALRPAAVSPMLSDAVRRQLDFMRQSGAPNRHAYVISDFQRSAADLPALPHDSLAAVTLVPLVAVGADNVFVDTLRLDAPAYFTGGSVSVDVRVRNSGDRDVEKVPVRLYVDGRERALATVDIAAGASADVSLKFSLDREGWVDGRVVIDDYPITFDDSYGFTFHVGNRIAVLEVDGHGPNESLDRLFGADSAVDLRHVQHIPASLDGENVVLLNEPSDLSDGEAQLLASWVSEGGSLVVVLPQESCPKRVSDLLASVQAPLPERWTVRGVRATTLDYASVLYRGVFNGRDDDMELPSVQGHYTLSTGAAVRQSVITLADGTDLLCVTPCGAGRVYLFSTPLRQEWTDFTAQALFVPTFYNIALYSLPLPPVCYTLGYDEPVVLHGTYDLGAKLPELVGPDSSRIIPDIRKVGNRQLLIPHGDIAVDGIYMLADEHLAFNYPRRESVMDFMTHAEIDGAVSGMPGYSTVRNADKPLADELLGRDGGRRLWRLCLVVALAALAAEVALLKIKPRRNVAS